MKNFSEFVNDSAKVEPSDRIIFTPDRTNLWWFSLTLESNGEVNKKLEENAKIAITRILVDIDGFNIVELYSFVHCNIIFGVNTSNPHVVFKKIHETLSKPIVENTPSILINLTLAARSDNEIYLHINGSKKMNENFLNSISDFFTNP